MSHTTTFGGNPLACAVADRVIAHIVETDLPARAATAGQRTMDAIRALGSPHVRDIRGLGLMIGIELKRPAAKTARAVMDEGVLRCWPARRVLRLLPPLVIEADELDTVVAALGRVLA